MKIGIAYPNEDSYSETFIQNHLRYLNPDISLTGGWRPYKTQEGKSIILMPGSEIFRVFIKRGIGILYPEFYTYFLRQYLNKEKPDVLLAEYGITGVGVMEACKKTNTSLVVHFHGFDASHKPTVDKYRIEYQQLFEIATKIVAVSNDMVSQLEQLGVPSSKIVNNPYGVETSKFYGAKPINAEKIVMAVGRFTGKKAPELTIKAFDKVLEKHVDAKLIMIGDGPLLKPTIRLVDELQMKHAVEILGKQPNNVVAEWYKKARLFVQHSIVDPLNGDCEGTPNTILEASSSGLPVVSTLHGGIKDAINHGETGFLVQEGDYVKMADYICELLENPSLAQKMGEKGREKMEREYEMGNQIKKLKNILQWGADL